MPANRRVPRPSSLPPSDLVGRGSYLAPRTNTCSLARGGFLPGSLTPPDPGTRFSEIPAVLYCVSHPERSSMSTASPSPRPETISLHGGQVPDPTTNARAVPIYQTVGYAFDDTQHAEDLFALAVPGNIYTRIMNPTWDVLEQRVTALEGAVAACVTASGQAAVTYAVLNVCRSGDNIVALSTLYGGTYNLFAHTLPQYGIEVRFVDPDAPGDLAAHVDDKTTPGVRRDDRQPARQRGRCGRLVGGRARTRPAAGGGQHHRDADPDPGPRPRRRHRDPLADQVHRRSRHLHRRHRRGQRHLRLDRPRRPLPGPHEARPLLPRGGLERRPRAGGLHRPRAHRAAAQHGRRPVAVQRVPVPAGHRDAAPAHGAPLRERPGRGDAPRGPPAGDLGLVPGPGVVAVPRGRRPDPDGRLRRDPDLRHQGRPRGRAEVHRFARPVQPHGEHRRREVAGHPPAHDDPLRSSTTPSSRRRACPQDMVRLSIGIEHIDDILGDIDQALAAAGD